MERDKDVGLAIVEYRRRPGRSWPDSLSDILSALGPSPYVHVLSVRGHSTKDLDLLRKERDDAHESNRKLSEELERTKAALAAASSSLALRIESTPEGALKTALLEALRRIEARGEIVSGSVPAHPVTNNTSNPSSP